MTYDSQRNRQDAARLMEAVNLIERIKLHQAIPAPGAEFILHSVAQLLKSIASAIERNQNIPDNVRQAAEIIAGHLLHYTEQYLPFHD
jgi:hypothetical protein